MGGSKGGRDGREKRGVKKKGKEKRKNGQISWGYSSMVEHPWVKFLILRKREKKRSKLYVATDMHPSI